MILRCKGQDFVLLFLFLSEGLIPVFKVTSERVV